MTNKNEINLKVKLAEHLDCDIEDIWQGYDESTFESGDMEYLVLTDEEADERAKEHIEQTVWAFSAWFLSDHTNIDKEIIQHLQDKCEGANELLLRSIIDFDAFVDEAVSIDGRGHFLASYDGHEHDLDNNLFLYRLN